MAIKITWQEPDDTNITQIRVSKSTTKHGSYSIASTFDATDDGNPKGTTNNWVTEYFDASGTDTNWYRIEFYDGTNLVWSQYSDAITGNQRAFLCSVGEVKRVIDTVGRWTDSEILDAIQEVDEDIYDEIGTPIKAVISDVGYDSSRSTTYKTYYVGEENIYRVDRVFLGTITKTEYFLDDGYKVNRPYGMIRFLPVASGGPVVDRSQEVEIRFIPKIYNRYAIYKTCKHLLEGVDYAGAGSTSKELEVIERRLKNIEKRLNERVGFGLSTEFRNYDPVYNVNRRKLIQDHDRNRYLASYGW